SHYFVGRDVMGAYAGVEQRYPFANRRLLEFLIRVPGGWHFKRGVQKMMLRDGLRGVLPESIRCRRGKIVFNDVFVSPFDYKKPTESRIVNEKYMSDRAL